MEGRSGHPLKAKISGFTLQRNNSPSQDGA
jgi:hypothetical protein